MRIPVIVISGSIGQIALPPASQYTRFLLKPAQVSDIYSAIDLVISNGEHGRYV